MFAWIPFLVVTVISYYLRKLTLERISDFASCVVPSDGVVVRYINCIRERYSYLIIEFEVDGVRYTGKSIGYKVIPEKYRVSGCPVKVKYVLGNALNIVDVVCDDIVKPDDHLTLTGITLFFLSSLFCTILLFVRFLFFMFY